ncbi:hypothetical protein [Mesorhizobium sp. WSM2239]|uniref:Uncharacterized protein n=2 Tax=unclassified Mesorhizobium TaxID=325217 RepID=A0AAU8DJB8_9HYPH
MSKLYLCFSAALIFNPVTYAHAQAAPSVQTVVDACSGNDAACSQAARDYLAALRDANLPSEQYDQGVADLVVALATTAANDEVCDDSDRLAAAAISLASTFTTNVAQRAQIDDIAVAVNNCTEIETAALTSPAAEAASPN